MCKHDLQEVTCLGDIIRKYICMYCDYKEERIIEDGGPLTRRIKEIEKLCKR